MVVIPPRDTSLNGDVERVLLNRFVPVKVLLRFKILVALIALSRVARLTKVVVSAPVAL
jgi:hypothetical protein